MPGQVGAEAVRDDVVRVAHEDGPVAQPREAGDVLDHLGVVVGGDVRLPGTAVGHRQPADEVGHPHERGPLELGVLVQEVVHLPRLVADDQVVLAFGDDVVEDHEVRHEDLVHSANGLETVQVVFGRLGLDVRRLADQQAGCRVDPLVRCGQYAGHRVLGQPVDLQVRLACPQLLGDGDVAASMPQPDRRREVQGLRRTTQRAGPRPRWRGRLRRYLIDELTQHEVEANRVAHVRSVATAAERQQGCAG